jgi:hypothetical protein
MVVARLPLLLALVALAAPAEAAPRRGGPAVAVWDLHVDDAHRTEASHWYARFADALAEVPELRADSGRVFRPSVRPAEGLTVASYNAQRWLEASWVAFQGGELEAAADLVADALRLVEPYPAARLPEGLVRDMHLLRGRVLLELGRREPAEAALKAATILDPGWEPDPRFERPEFLVLWGRLAAQRDQAPRGLIAVDVVEPGATVLVYGVPQGTAGADGRLELYLPGGLYEITGRKPGFADRTERVHVKPGANEDVDLAISVQNSPGFQEALAAALASPADQRASTVWAGLERACVAVDARAILVGRFDAGLQQLQVGLYLPGRAGWGWYAAMPITRDLGFDERRVEGLRRDLVDRMQAALWPTAFAGR